MSGVGITYLVLSDAEGSDIEAYMLDPGQLFWPSFDPCIFYIYYVDTQQMLAYSGRARTIYVGPDQQMFKATTTLFFKDDKLVHSEPVGTPFSITSRGIYIKGTDVVADRVQFQKTVEVRQKINYVA